MDYKQLSGIALDEYHLEEIIGSGGMSAVYRAYQEELDRHVAVKVLSSQLAKDENYVYRFNQEAKMAASLEHPHIVPVYDFGIHNDMMYVVMRLLTRGTLREKMQGQAMNRNEAMNIITPIAQALDYAHAREIVHRDVKPGNIMFDTQGIPYLVDFGIAKATQQNVNITAENIVLGTPRYMPPEQWKGIQPVPATDQYALAVIAYEMLTGYPAFAGDTSQNLMYQHINEMPKLAHQVNSSLSSNVSLVLQQALAKEPQDRYPRISNFGNALGQALRQPSAQETQEHQAVETLVNQPAPHPQPQPQPAYQPPVQPMPLPSTPKSRSATTSLIGGGLIGLILLVIFIIAGGFVISQLTPQNSPPTSIPVTATDQVSSGIQLTEIQPTSIVLTSAPQADIDIVGLSDVSLNQRAVINNEPTIPVRDAAFSPDGQIIASAHGDGTVRFWREGIPTRVNAHSEVASAVAFSPDGQFVASVGRDNNLQIWRVADGQKIQTLTGHTAALRDVAFSPDGTRVATASEDWTVRIWRVNDWSPETTLRGHENRVLSLAFSPDSTLLASGGQENRVYLWDMTELRFNRYLDGHTEAIRGVDFSPDGRKLVSSSTDNTLKIWDLNTNQVLHSMDGHGRDVWTVKFSPDGKVVASGGRDNTLRLWDVESGSQLTNITNHSGWVLGIDFSPDASSIISASGDGTIRIWE